MSTSDDEFDNLPDDLCQVIGVDWDQILPAPPLPSADPSQDTLQHDAIAARSPSADSSQYSYDDDDLDSAFFAELDNLEKDIVQSQPGPSRIALNDGTRSSEHSLKAQGNDSISPSETRSSDLVHAISFPENTRQPVASSSSCFRPKSESSPSRKRAREPSPLIASNKKGKGKAQENEDVWQVLSGIEDELTCPICSDIFVAVHICNPCGHSVCGECGWQWKKKGKASCAICRTELARDMPMIPNFAMDNTVEKHVEALGQSGILEWKVGGSKYVEWLSRKEQWRQGAVERTKAKIPEKQPNQAIIVWEILGDDELDEIDYDDFDSGSRLLEVVLSNCKTIPSMSSLMRIVFSPALSEINRIPIDDLPALLNFTATLSAADYSELKRDGGRVQLWSDVPFEGAPAPYSEWTSCDFGLNAAAGSSNLSSAHEISSSLVDDDDLPSPGTVVLTLQLLVPPSGNDQRRCSYTYRILYPSGEIRWLGEFGQNGTLVCEHTTTETALGLAAGWTRNEGMYMWTDKTIRTDTPILRPEKPDEYLAWTVGGKNGAFLALLTTRHTSRSVSMPLEYVLCASPTSVMHVSPEKTITVTGDGPLVMSSLPRRQSDLRLLKSMIMQHCSPEHVTVTLIGEETKCLLLTTKNMLPVEGLTMTTPNLSLSIPTDTLRSFLPSQTTPAPFLLFAPHTFRAHLVTNVETVSFTSPGPFILSPAFNITSKVYVSILSPHKSAQLVEPTAGNLPTPPPSPEWVPRSIISRQHSSSHLYETASSTPESVAVQSVDEADDSDTQDDSNVNEEIVKPSPRLHLKAVALRTKYLLSVALFVLTMVFKLIFGKSTPENEGAEPKENAGEHVEADDQPKVLDKPVVDVQEDALDQKRITNDSNGAGVNASHVHATPQEPLGLASDSTIEMPRPVASGPYVSEIPGPKVLLVEVDGSSTVRLTVWEGETCGVVSAEMNGKRIPVCRMNVFPQAETRVEFWELAVDAGGMLRISYDHDKMAC